MHKTFFLGTIFLVLLFCSCLTPPMLQSSRIRGKGSLGGVGDLSPNKFTTVVNKTDSSIMKASFQPADMISYGKKLEIQGIAFSVITQSAWSAGLKLNLVDIGNRQKKFQNVGVALFSASNGFQEMERRTFYLNVNSGIILGTSFVVNNHEFEWVISPGFQYYRSYDQLSQVDSVWVYSDIRQKCFSLGTGIFWYPWFSKLGIEVGVGGRYIFPIAPEDDYLSNNDFFFKKVLVQIALRKYWGTY